MYWPVKAFLWLLGLAVLAGGVYFAWPYLPKPKVGGGDDNVESAAVVPSGGGGKEATTPARRRRVRMPSRHAAKLQLARKTLPRDPVKARSIVENILRDPDLTLHSDPWYRVTQVLSEINTRILFSDCPCEDKEDYTVQRGDSVGSIAKRFQTTYAMVRRGNKLSPEDYIYPEQTLRIYRGNWNIRISKSQYTMRLFDAERLIMVYRIGIGKQNRTPEGSFIIKSGGKQKDPTWWYRGRKIPPDDPENPLGTRWMALAGTDDNTVTLRGYGIHGTKERDSIGKQSSNGCIRMLNEQVEELYDIVPEGTPVVIEK